MKVGSINSTAISELSSRRNISAETAQVKEAVGNGDPVQTNMEKKVQVHEPGQVDDEVLEKAVEQANKTLEKHNRYIERNIHEVTKAVMYKLKDSETNEVIAEFPPQKVQDMIAKMWELAGLFVDGRG
ncbi:MAG: flagellar protein FlaG [Clostridia bacterium]|nr:flagellar protein FlaG [Clostridia bacterium]